MLPIFYMLSMSLRSAAEVAASPLGLPTTLHGENYVKVIGSMNYVRSVANTVLITIVTTAIVAIVSLLAAYPLARVRSRMSGLVYAVDADRGVAGLYRSDAGDRGGLGHLARGRAL